jgi:hypothetical protein
LGEQPGVDPANGYPTFANLSPIVEDLGSCRSQPGISTTNVSLFPPDSEEASMEQLIAAIVFGLMLLWILQDAFGKKK